MEKAGKVILKNQPIDIIIPWVDGNNPEWLETKNKYLGVSGADSNANSNARYESWNNLHLIFRGIERFMPWAHKVFLVVCGREQIPEFLNTGHPKLRIVTHEEYIPKEYLPTFNSNTIEMNYFRIEDLSENFILFNDDIFPISEIEERYYFQDGMVCDEAVESPIMPVDVGQITEYSCMVKINNLLFINRHFQKRKVQRNNREKWFYSGYGELLQRTEGLGYWDNFVGFHDRHMPVALKKSVMRHLWEIEPERLALASSNHFRSYTDLSQCLVRYWQLCTGNFVPRKTLGEPYLVTADNYKAVADDIAGKPHQMVCLTEDCTPEEFTVIRDEINRALESIMPGKSSFEK